MRREIIFLMSFFIPSLALPQFIKALNKNLEFSIFGVDIVPPFSYFFIGAVTLILCLLYLIWYWLYNLIKSQKFDFLKITNFYINFGICMGIAFLLVSIK